MIYAILIGLGLILFFGWSFRSMRKSNEAAEKLFEEEFRPQTDEAVTLWAVEEALDNITSKCITSDGFINLPTPYQIECRELLARLRGKRAILKQIKENKDYELQ